jgi:hypothetical protein
MGARRLRGLLGQAAFAALLSAGCNAILGLDDLGEGGSPDTDPDPGSRVEVVEGRVSTPALAAGEDGFALAWTETTDEAAQTGEVELVLLNRDGGLIGEPATISEGQGIAQGTPRLAGSGKGYGSAWFTRHDVPGPVDIYTWSNSFVALGSTGSPLGDIVTQSSPAEYPWLIWDGNDWVLAWPDGTLASNWELSLQKYGIGMKPVWPEKLRVTNSGGSEFGVALAALGDRTAAAWYQRDAAPGADGKLHRHVQLSIRGDFGAASGAPVDVTDSPDDDFAGVQVAAGKTTFGLCWLTISPVSAGGEERTVFFQAFQLDGTAVGEPVPLSSSNTPFAPAQLYFDGNNYGIVWGDDAAIKFARVGEAGAIEEASVLLGGLDTSPEGVVVAWGTDRLALAWREGGETKSARLVVQVVPIPGT